MVRHLVLGWGLLLAAALEGAVAAAPEGRALAEEILALQALQKGSDTAFDEVERRGADLLKKYPRLEQQALIHHQLACVYGVSGAAKQDRAIEHARQALRLPLDPRQRMRMYVYWGDATYIANQKRPLSEVRRMAAPIFLEGLKELRTYNVPETAPELPRLERQTGLAQPGKADDDAQRAYEQQLAARKRAEFEQEMCRHRDVLVRQVAYLYCRKPYAGSEIRELASRILQDPAAVDAVLKPIEAKGALVDSEPAAPPPTEEVPAPRPHFYLFVIAGHFLALIAVVGVILIVKARRRRAASADSANTA
jgi:hypothetical protein